MIGLAILGSTGSIGTQTLDDRLYPLLQRPDQLPLAFLLASLEVLSALLETGVEVADFGFLLAARRGAQHHLLALVLRHHRVAGRHHILDLLLDGFELRLERAERLLIPRRLLHDGIQVDEGYRRRRLLNGSHTHDQYQAHRGRCPTSDFVFHNPTDLVVDVVRHLSSQMFAYRSGDRPPAWP